MQTNYLESSFICMLDFAATTRIFVICLVVLV